MFWSVLCTKRQENKPIMGQWRLQDASSSRHNYLLRSAEIKRNKLRPTCKWSGHRMAGYSAMNVNQCDPLWKYVIEGKTKIECFLLNVSVFLMISASSDIFKRSILAWNASLKFTFNVVCLNKVFKTDIFSIQAGVPVLLSAPAVLWLSSTKWDTYWNLLKIKSCKLVMNCLQSIKDSYSDR